MDSRRSTRRSVNPPGNGSGTTSTELGGWASLEEVEQILDEIEGLVSSDGREETARPKPVLEDPAGRRDHGGVAAVETPVDVDAPEVDRLQVDLEQAIVRELGANRDPGPEGASAAPAKGSVAPMTTSPRPGTTDGEEKSDGVPPEESGIREAPPAEVHVLLAPFVRFMAGFSARERMLINVFAISMALWVPLVWWLAMTTTPSIDGTLGGEASMDREPPGIRSTIPSRTGLPGGED